MAKLFASEVAVRVANELRANPWWVTGSSRTIRPEKYYRDVKLCNIGEGTSEIQRLVMPPLLGKTK